METSSPQPNSSETTEKAAKKTSVSKLLLIVIGVLILVPAAFGVWYFSNNSKPAAPKTDHLAATVNGEEILKKDYEANLKSQQDFYNKTYPEVLKQKAPEQVLKNLPVNVMDRMIQQVLLTQFLKEKGIEITTQQAKDHLYKEVVEKNYGGDWDKYQKELDKTYTTLDQAINNFKMDLIVSKVSEIEKLDVTNFGDWYKKLKDEATIKIYVKI